MFSRSRLLFLVVAFALPLAGCIKGGDAETPPTVEPEINTTSENNATLPDGRGESAGIAETNKTEAGVGGVEHKHDYWQGKDRVVLFDEVVPVSCPPCMPDGEGTDPKSVAYVKLADLPAQEGTGAALVYEGADKVEVLFGDPFYDASDFLIGEPGAPAAHPAPPVLKMQYRSAADADWTAPIDVTYNTPVVIEVDPKMTDMPHSTHSLWVFRLTTDRPEAAMEVPMTVTVVKGREVVDWPGHPDFYAETTTRKVMEQHVTTHMSGLESAVLYDSGGTWAHPERLISWGTKEIVVILNITGARNAYGATPTGYFLEVHNATVIGPEISFGARFHEIDGKNDLASYQFIVPVDETGMDGPYQPASRWGFRAMATFADIVAPVDVPDPAPQGVGLCPGCFPYDIEYDIVVLATNAESGRAEAWEP